MCLYYSFHMLVHFLTVLLHFITYIEYGELAIYLWEDDLFYVDSCAWSFSCEMSQKISKNNNSHMLYLYYYIYILYLYF